MKLRNFVLILAVSAALSGYSAWALASKEPIGSSISAPSNGNLELIRLAEAHRLWHDPQTLFLDVRSPEDYTVGHIAGAVNLPEEDFETRFPDLEPRLRQARAIVVYCQSRDCGKSLWAAIRLRHEGLMQTQIYPEGWNEWSAHGLPTARTAP